MKKTQDKRIIVIAILSVLLLVLLGMLAVNLKTVRAYENLSCTEKTTWNHSGVEIQIPDVYYAASGLTMEIYNNQITNQGAHISEFDVVWETEVGEVQDTKFSVTADDEMIGEHPLSVSVYDKEGTLLAKKESVLKIVEAKQWQFSILVIGDSLSADGAFYSRMQEHLGNLMICNGTLGYEGYLTEARLGFSAEDYLTETGYYVDEGEEVHKFWNPESERFDWNYYKETTGFNPDVILLHLGTNGLLSGDENAENICKIVELIRQDDKNIPIYVVNTIYQSDQNGIGSKRFSSSGYLMFPGEYKQQRDLANFRLREYLTEELSDMKNIYLVPASISVDSESVFEMEERPVNPYSEITESVAVDPVHPKAEGYCQIADTVYSTMCATMEEW